MIVLNIKCKNPEEMAKFRDRMCEALVGSPAFKNNMKLQCVTLPTLIRRFRYLSAIPTTMMWNMI